MLIKSFYYYYSDFTFRMRVLVGPPLRLQFHFQTLIPFFVCALFRWTYLFCCNSISQLIFCCRLTWLFTRNSRRQPSTPTRCPSPIKNFTLCTPRVGVPPTSKLGITRAAAPTSGNRATTTGKSRQTPAFPISLPFPAVAAAKPRPSRPSATPAPSPRSPSRRSRRTSPPWRSPRMNFAKTSWFKYA